MAPYSQATLRDARKFIRQPDKFYFDGGQHSPLGYSEQQYSLSRWIDLTVSRQGLLDDVWTKPAVLGWMFLPMKPYHAGGDGASFEPYSEHLQSYEFALSQYLGSGCGMTYRGDKLYVSVPTARLRLVVAMPETGGWSGRIRRAMPATRWSRRRLLGSKPTGTS